MENFPDQGKHGAFFGHCYSSDNPENVCAAATGNAWSPNEERVLFGSVDGGDNWQMINSNRSVNNRDIP
ncbi:MAG: hypothetical protein ACQETA_09690 [Bacteroidota bacterium]